MNYIYNFVTILCIRTNLGQDKACQIFEDNL